MSYFLCMLTRTQKLNILSSKLETMLNIIHKNSTQIYPDNCTKCWIQGFYHGCCPHCDYICKDTYIERGICACDMCVTYMRSKPEIVNKTQTNTRIKILMNVIIVNSFFVIPINF